MDLIQIRERDLTAREITSIAQRTLSTMSSTHSAVLINDRADIAASVGSGVHLTTRSISASIVRQTFGSEILIGVSTHNEREALAAQEEGADFVVFGPVFDTSSKQQYGPPVGLNALEAVVAKLRIPVIGLGGIGLNNFDRVLDTGAAGIAGISLFAHTEDLAELVDVIKGVKKREAGD